MPSSTSISSGSPLTPRTAWSTATPKPRHPQGRLLIQYRTVLRRPHQDGAKLGGLAPGSTAASRSTNLESFWWCLSATSATPIARSAATRSASSVACHYPRCSNRLPTTPCSTSPSLLAWTEDSTAAATSCKYFLPPKSIFLLSFVSFPRAQQSSKGLG